MLLIFESKRIIATSESRRRPIMIDTSHVPSRTFISPSGRQWTATLAAASGTRGPAVVLRFTSSDVVFDLEQWPADWGTFSDEDLVLLLRAAKPPRLGLPIPHEEPQRAERR